MAFPGDDGQNCQPTVAAYILELADDASGLNSSARIPKGHGLSQADTSRLELLRGRFGRAWNQIGPRNSATPICQPYSCAFSKKVGGNIYAVSGGALYWVEAMQDTLNLGAVDDAADLFRQWRQGQFATIGTYYVWDGTTFGADLRKATFSSVGSVDSVSRQIPEF